MNRDMNGSSNGDGSKGSNGFGMFPTPLLSDLQRLGFDTASQVVKGYLDLLGRERPPRPAEPVNGQEPSFAQLRVNVARALDLYGELIRRSFEGYADMMERGLRVAGLRLGAEGSDGDAPLTLHADRPGVLAVGTVWIHNTTAEPASVELRLTDLTAHDGTVVQSGSGTFVPQGVTATPGNPASARLEILLGGVAPGVYHGHVMARGLPDEALPVRLVIAPHLTGPPP